MLRINRLRVEINTVKGVYGIDKAFEDGLNFIASLENTCGKSSILAAIEKTKSPYLKRDLEKFIARQEKKSKRRA